MAFTDFIMSEQQTFKLRLSKRIPITFHIIFNVQMFTQFTKLFLKMQSLDDNNNINNNNNNNVVLVRERTILIERPPLCGEVSANF
jgi:hypothetical protein